MSPGESQRGGPLHGVRIIELAGIGPGPFAGMLFADLGADVLRIERAGRALPIGDGDLLGRGRPAVAVDLKSPQGVALVLDLVEGADALIEGFRPGVVERLGVGPQPCLERNPRLVYGRITGWGQEGPLATRAGHDIDYIAVAGALGAFAREGERPVPPVNLVGDFGGGGMLLVVGVLAALLEVRGSGRGQVVDAAMVDGAALLMTMVYELRARGLWPGPAGTNLLDTGAPFYDVYTCQDGRHVAVGALEPQFYAALLEGLGLAGEELPSQHDRAGWPRLRRRFAEVFASRDRDAWAEHFAGTDACVAPVLDLEEAPRHPHIAARRTFLDGASGPRTAPAPRFSRTPAAGLRTVPQAPDTLERFGLDAERIAELRRSGVLTLPGDPSTGGSG